MTTPCALIFQLHIVVPHMHGANIWTPQQQNNDHDDSPRSHKSICHDLSPQEDGKDNFFPPSLRKSGMKWNNLVCECDDTTQSKPRCFLDRHAFRPMKNLNPHVVIFVSYREKDSSTPQRPARINFTNWTCAELNAAACKKWWRSLW